MDIMIVLLGFIFVIGLIIGSFLNVCVLRALSGESIVLPPSKCPQCGNKLKWWHNIPVLSYILLRGKCGFCSEKISIQYPIIELITGMVFVLAVLKYGVRVETVFALIISCLLIIIAGTDVKEKVVFDFHTYSLIVVGLIYSIYLTAFELIKTHQLVGTLNITPEWIVSNPLASSIFGIILGAVIMEIAARSGYLLAGTRAFGEGDSYIAAGLGAIFGWKSLIVILISSVFIQLVFTLPVFIKKLIKTHNSKTLLSILLFFGYALSFFAFEHFGYFKNSTVYIASIVLLIVFGLFACRQIIKGMKTSDELTYLPFGPALVIAAMVLLLF